MKTNAGAGRLGENSSNGWWAGFSFARKLSAFLLVPADVGAAGPAAKVALTPVLVDTTPKLGRGVPFGQLKPTAPNTNHT